MSRAQRVANCTIIVTDHAVVRYLERVAGVKIEDIRKEIARLAYDSTPFKTKGGARWNWDKQIVIFMEGDTVTTVIGREDAKLYEGQKLIDGQRV